MVTAGFYSPEVKATYVCVGPDGTTGPSTPSLHIDIVGYPPGYTVQATLSGPAGVVSGPDNVAMQQNGTSSFDGGSSSFPKWAPAGLAARRRPVSVLPLETHFRTPCSTGSTRFLRAGPQCL